MNRSCWCNAPEPVETNIPNYWQCRSCGTFISKLVISTDALKQYYGIAAYWRGHVINKYGHPPIDQRAHNDFQDRIPHWWDSIKQIAPSKESILEIGCAHGGFLHLCRENGVKRVVGIEVDEATCQFAREKFNLPEVYSGLWPDVPVEGEFDVICGFDVFEHFEYPMKAMQAVKQRLAPNGIYVWQTPCWSDNQYFEHFKPEEHLYIFTLDAIKEFMSQAGMTINFIPAIFPNDMMIWGTRAE